ncbi:uncharacterized protein LOC127733644 [Mytilus californianus]|uniref:uncharacterized protein LOC127733644 n=1 Tax=Mytilus californianus TaxID=6549 RepID=UPI002247FA7B|nr:uncharacterized protein LOC127733644 [Mytilus californianus]
MFIGGAGGKGTWGAPGDELFEDGSCRDAKDPNYDSDSQLSRVLSEFKSFSWLKSITSDHIPHPFTRQMREKYQLKQLFLGTTDTLTKYNIVVGGDQLTRVHLEGSKHLLLQALNPVNRFEHLNPVICEFWHLKQDFLEKLYKHQLYITKTLREQGTLAYFRTLLRRTDVNGKIKSNFQGHANLIKIVVKRLIVEQFLSFFNMQNENDNNPSPANLNIQDNVSSANKITKVGVQREIIGLFFEILWVYSYKAECIDYLSKHMAELYGRMYRLSSKYMAECIDYILKVEFFSSPLNKLRILEDSFVNVKGGTCKNVEADMVQEHHVRHQKDLIKQIGANKSNVAISRTTSDSNILASIIDNFDTSNGINRKTPSYTKFVFTEEEHIIRPKLREFNYFEYSVNRQMEVIEQNL